MPTLNSKNVKLQLDLGNGVVRDVQAIEVNGAGPQPLAAPAAANVTLRQYAAIKAMGGLLPNSNGPIQGNAMCGWSLCNCDENDVAALSVKLADALLAELEK